MAHLLPRFTDLETIRREAREAPGIDDMPTESKKQVFESTECLRGIPVIGSGGGAIPGTRPDQRKFDTKWRAV